MTVQYVYDKVVDVVRKGKWTDQDRQRFSDRDVLRAKTVPAKDKPAPETDEWGDDPVWKELES